MLTNDLSREALSRLKVVTTRKLKVGFFPMARYPETENDDGAYVAHVAYAHEYGNDVPRRPFFSNAVTKGEALFSDVFKEVLRRGGSIEQAFDQVGQVVSDAVKQSITELDTPPNSEETIARKGSSNPLIDTGHMRDSVTWQVVKK